MSGIELIVQERNKQLQHGYTADHDKKYESGELLLLAELLMSENAAECKNLSEALIIAYGFKPKYLAELKASPRIEQLTKAGALIAAEIDRYKTML